MWPAAAIGTVAEHLLIRSRAFSSSTIPMTEWWRDEFEATTE
jgi:hypothetical protein